MRVLMAVKRSPLAITSLIGLIFLLIVSARGLPTGALQTDVIIIRAWFEEVGIAGFPGRYFDVNQRHILVGPIMAALFALFGKQDAPYHLIILGSRVFQGVFLAGVVFQQTQRRLFAVCAGLMVMFSVMRVPELFQGLNYHIEPTLVLLVASSYTYLRALRSGSQRAFWLWYAVSVALYGISILTYESGLPWVAVNACLGWLARPELPQRRRVWLTVRDALLPLAFAIAIFVLVLFVFRPWATLAPDPLGLPLRLVQQLASALTLPAFIAHALAILFGDGYAIVVLIGVAATGLLMFALKRDPGAGRPGFLACGGLGAVMLLSSVLVGVSSGNVTQAYLDRITFGRVVGVSLFYVSAIFAMFDFVKLRAGALLTMAMIAGTGFAWLWAYQDYAQASRAEIDRMTNIIMQNRSRWGSPLHLVIVTDPDWPPARFVDTSDAVLHEIQQKLWELGGGATIDILHTGANSDEYSTHPGTCNSISGEASSGLCLEDGRIYGSRWSSAPSQSLQDVVVVHYHQREGTLSLIRAVSLDNLRGYNIASAGPTMLESSAERILASGE